MSHRTVNFAERYTWSGTNEWSLSTTWSCWKGLLWPTFCWHWKATGLSSFSISPDFAVRYSQTHKTAPVL